MQIKEHLYARSDLKPHPLNKNFRKHSMPLKSKFSWEHQSLDQTQASMLQRSQKSSLQQSKVTGTTCEYTTTPFKANLRSNLQDKVDEYQRRKLSMTTR